MMDYKKPIRILDLNFNLLCEIEDYDSLVFTRYYNSIGSFELKVNKNKQNAKYLKKNMIVYLQNNKCGIILYREVEIGSNGPSSEVVYVKGYDLLGLLKKRIIMPPSGKANWEFTGNAEEGIKSLISDNIGDTAADKRKIPFFHNADVHGFGENISISSRYDNLDEKVLEIAQLNELGIKVYFDYENKCFVFDVYEGVKRVTSQNAIPPVLFSIDFGNMSSQRLTDSIMDYKNYALVAGQGEGVDREIKEVDIGNQTGYYRDEMFVDARDIGADSKTTLEERGKEKLSENKAVFTMEGDVIPYNTFDFEKDYFIGDIVSAKMYDVDEIIMLDARITSSKEYWDNSGYKVELTFGNEIPNLIKKMKNEMKTISDSSVEIATAKDCTGSLQKSQWVTSYWTTKLTKEDSTRMCFNVNITYNNTNNTSSSTELGFITDENARPKSNICFNFLSNNGKTMYFYLDADGHFGVTPIGSYTLGKDGIRATFTYSLV